ncbi:hypothetical protein CEXT_421321 [Caerostris extrusa]|uniref:Uncharacterized protein n=1 Tax=Caerostris extrusa TaxID=172846 RepID=A0AAV4WGA8_CAEEX|nr:hypothetical protein CEXT_421321 [Caerostris extrusa]
MASFRRGLKGNKKYSFLCIPSTLLLGNKVVIGRLMASILMLDFRFPCGTLKNSLPYAITSCLFSIPGMSEWFYGHHKSTAVKSSFGSRLCNYQHHPWGVPIREEVICPRAFLRGCSQNVANSLVGLFVDMENRLFHF